jgi:hypothetical protein
MRRIRLLIVLPVFLVAFAACGLFPKYHLGDTGPSGGLIFFAAYYPGGWHYMEVAPVYDMSLFWSNTSVYLGASETGIGSGVLNTEQIASFGVMGAASEAQQFSYNGYDDWFLPSLDELKYVHQNIAAQGLGAWQNDWYWSSSENGMWTAWVVYFGDAALYVDSVYKDEIHAWCAARAFED